MSKPENKLFLLDAMALIYRAHFAFSKNPRINSKGLNTGAVLGFTNSLVEILTKEKPTHIAVAFDTSEPTFRHKEFPEYKAQREEQPEDIRVAIPIVKEVVQAFNIPVIEKHGFEADDIIGTIATQVGHKGNFEVFMMTPDKDYGQLVQEHVYLYKPSYMGNSVEVLGVEEVLKKWDIERIDQVADMLGLQGDASDNIPGIPGVGPKTASKLLKTYGSVEGLVENAHELKGKQKERVTEFGQQGILSKRLATIVVDVPVEYTIEGMAYDGPNKEVLEKLFKDLEFRTLAKRILGEAPTKAAPKNGQQDLFAQSTPAPAASTPTAAEEAPTEAQPLKNISGVIHDYRLVDTPELRKELAGYLALQKEFCFDTETSALDAYNSELVGISFSYVPHEAYYLPVNNEEHALEVLADFKEVFENAQIGKIGQNIKYDLLVLKKYGFNVRGPLFDTMIVHYLIEPESRHNMTALAEHYLHYTPVPIEDLIGAKGKKQGSMKDVPLAQITEYAAEDADITLQLKHKLEDQIDQYEVRPLYQSLEGPLIEVLAQMERKGVCIDPTALSGLSKDLEDDVARIEKEIFEMAGVEFNIASPKQLGEVLFEKLKLVEKPKKTKTGQYATGEEILTRLTPEHAIARKILDYRELVKLKNTYVDALPALVNEADGRIHTSYNQAVAATGRLSSTNPNLQNIPIRTERGREIRKAFVAPNEDYVIMAADYSQIELRIMASFAKDEHMIEAFKNGRDIHATTAAKIFKVPLEEVDSNMRRKAKTANFGIIYGISAFGLSQRLDIPRTEAAEIINAYFEEFPAVKQYMDQVINQAREQEYVSTIKNRRRYLRDINSRNQTQRGFAERNAINAPIQGSAADIIKEAMIAIDAWMRQANTKSSMIMQVHDELVFEVHKDEVELMKNNISQLMKQAATLEVPMEVEVGLGQNWLQAH